MIDGQNVFDLRTHEEIVIGHGDDYITGFLLSCPYFKENYQLIAIDLSKQQALEADLKTLQIEYYRYRLNKTNKKFFNS